MEEVRVTGRIVPDLGAEVHHITLRYARPGAFRDGATDCGVRPTAVFGATEDEPVSCEGCLAAEGSDALYEVERLLRERKPVPA